MAVLSGSSFTPVQTAGLSNIIAISAGWDQALALRSDHTVWAWGLNGVGELGDGTQQSADSSTGYQLE